MTHKVHVQIHFHDDDFMIIICGDANSSHTRIIKEMEMFIINLSMCVYDFFLKSKIIVIIVRVLEKKNVK